MNIQSRIILFENNLKTIIENHFWVITIVTSSVLSLLSFNFVKNLNFWREDYARIYNLNLHQLSPWPDQGTSILYFPLYLLFSNEPQGYYISGLMVYILFVLTTVFFALKLTSSKSTALIAGLILSSTYVGTEGFFLIEVGINSYIYLIGALILILLYLKSFEHKQQNNTLSVLKESLGVEQLRPWFLSFIIFSILMILISHRAYELILIIFLADLFITKIKHRNKYKYFTHLIIRFLPFAIVEILIILLFPPIFGVFPGFSNTIWGDNQAFSLNSFFLFIANLSNTLIYSPFQDIPILSNTSLVTGDSIDLYLHIVIFCILISSIFIFLVAKPRFRALTMFLVFAYILSYAPFHFLNEYNVIHPSWHRYFLYGLPFLSVLIGLLISEYFLKNKITIYRIFGYLLLGVIIVSNVYINWSSDFKNGQVKKSIAAKYFIKQLKEDITSVKERSLFYFDVVSDPTIAAFYNRSLACGLCSIDMVVASIFKVNSSLVMVTGNYNDFVKEAKKPEYKHIYAFFYNKDQKLVSLPISNKSYQQTLLLTTPLLADDSKRVIELPIPSFPSFYPVQVTLTLNAKLPQNINLTNHNLPSEPNLDKLLAYIKAQGEFRNQAKVITNSSQPGHDVEYLIDDDPNTFWVAAREMWYQDKQSWIQIDFDEPRLVSQIRWLSQNRSRDPLVYQYQILDNNKQWSTVDRVDSSKVNTKSWTIDNIPETITSSLRMLITKTSGDMPAIAELEVLDKQYDSLPGESQIFREHPFSKTLNSEDYTKIIDGLKNYLYIKVFPISDKFLLKDTSPYQRIRLIVDNKNYSYTLTLNPGGSYMNKLLFELPDFPIETSIISINLKTIN